MLVLITPMRARGKALEQREIQSAAPVSGDLLIAQQRSEVLNRTANVASILMTGAADTAPLPPLREAVVAWMGTTGFVVSGVELVDGVCYAQSWWCRPPA
jgi:hypothetical protein